MRRTPAYRLSRLGVRIDAALKERGHSIREAARLMGLGHSTLGNARLADKRTPTAETMGRIEAYLDGREYVPQFEPGFFKPLGERLERARIENRHSLTAVMEITGVSSAELCAARLGDYKVEPTAETVESLEEYISIEFNPPPEDIDYPLLTNSGVALGPPICETTNCYSCTRIADCHRVVTAGAHALCEHITAADIELLQIPRRNT